MQRKVGEADTELRSIVADWKAEGAGEAGEDFGVSAQSNAGEEKFSCLNATLYEGED